MCPRDASGKIVQASEQAARVRMEKRGKGKVVTMISGLDPVASDLSGLLKKLKSTCGAGGTIENGTIEVQGDHRERIAEFLRKLGYQVKSN
jgi:translation initiation factor 1